MSLSADLILKNANIITGEQSQAQSRGHGD